MELSESDLGLISSGRCPVKRSCLPAEDLSEVMQAAAGNFPVVHEF